MLDRQQAWMPEIRAIWEGFTLGFLTEAGEESQATLLESRAVIYSDDSWVRTAHDPRDPLRQYREEGDDGGRDILSHYQGYVRLSPPPSNV